jgi:hypothetical protein
MPVPPASLPARLRAFALVCLQLALLLLVVRRFDLESEKYFFPVLCMAAGGFAVHAWLPRRLRPGFFVLLSLAGTLFVLGWPNGAWVIGIGAGLIALCRLPVPLPVRVALLVVAGAQLAALRVQFPLPFWPVLASMFMFRLIVYVFETRHERGRPPLGHTLAYFFPLPNVCFPLFPVLDFKTFRQTYYDEDDYAVYQTGVAWVVRGVTHLLLYRVVKYYLLPAPHQLRDWPHLLLFLAANYALYLRVSGWFHIITGLLHLFGFNLPRTHHNYFLASSFSDVWRRINIYWKDFMTNVFFFPAFFALRRGGTRLALAGAALFVFLATWLLHSYQLFWLVGDLSVTRNDAVLWLGVGALVAVNLLRDLRRAAKSPPAEGKTTAPRKGRAVWGAVSLSLRTAGMFFLVSFFWACWTIPGFVKYLHVPSGLDGRAAAAGAALALGTLLGVVAAGALAKLTRDRLLRAGMLPLRVSLDRSMAVRLVALVLLALAGAPEVTAAFGPSAAAVAATLRRELRSPAEAGQLARGYYEEIADTHVQGGAWAGSLSGHDRFRGDPTHYLDMTRPAGPLLGRELIPGWRGSLAGRPVSVNSLGMRDREGITLHKPAGTCRVALVGSSVVMGYGVEDGQVFNRLLEDRLNAAAPAGGPRYELLNFGTGRSCSTQRRALVERRVLAFEPDALYYFAHQDEFIATVRHLAELVTTRTPLPYPGLTAAVRKAGVSPERSREDAEGQLLPLAREVVLGVYRGLVEDCRKHGVLPVWIYLPMPGVAGVSLQSAAFIDVAEEAGFVVLNLADWADGHEPAEVKLPGGDHHANALGHRLIAERLFAAFRERQDLLPAFARIRRPGG